MNLSNYIANRYNLLPSLQKYESPWHIITPIEGFIESHFDEFHKRPIHNSQ